jgi:cytochrome c biogenesis protein CcdA
MPVLATVVDWDALLKVVLFSLAGTVGVTAVFSLGIAGATGFAESRRDGRQGAAVGFGLLAVIAMGICVAAVVFGIVVMTSKD